MTTLTLVGQFSVPAGGRYPPVMGLPFGGVSGLTARNNNGREIFGISDARLGGRIYHFSLENPGGALRVDTVGAVSLAIAPGDNNPDHEGLAILSDGSFAVSTEGTGREPRLPPAIYVYGQHGDFVRRLPVPDKFIPEPTGSPTKGARGNAGFESLTLSPDGERLFTAAEMPLIQDGEAATIDAGGRTRILELAAREGTFEPAREFAYDLEPVIRPPFAPSLQINGLVDLLALNRTTLLALERGFVEDKDMPTHGLNCIRVFKITLDGATDISRLESLKEQGEVVAVTKTLLMDLSKVEGLSPELAPSLDNFEGLTFGPRLPDGRATLLLVSDDNFREVQRTWFLLFAIQ